MKNRQNIQSLPTFRPKPTAGHLPQAAATHVALLSRQSNPHWYKRIKSGQTPPQASLDLHGMTKTQAQDMLMRWLGRCVQEQLRCVYVSTGVGRGILSQALPSWIAQSRYAASILCVLPDHTAQDIVTGFYIVTKRQRDRSLPPSCASSCS